MSAAATQGTRRGRPPFLRADGKPAQVWTASDLAAALGVPVRSVRAQCRAGALFFPGAWEESSEWMIPARLAERALRGAAIEQHYSTAEAASLYSVSTKTIARLIAAGRIRTVTVLGSVRIPASALLAMEEGRAA